MSKITDNCESVFSHKDESWIGYRYFTLWVNLQTGEQFLTIETNIDQNGTDETTYTYKLTELTEERITK